MLFFSEKQAVAIFKAEEQYPHLNRRDNLKSHIRR